MKTDFSNKSFFSHGVMNLTQKEGEMGRNRIVIGE